jgi:K(+)-stimulated pyrophosphate-energized sodium pump
VLISLICGAAAVLGLALTRWVLAQSAGTDRMREIAAAIRGRCGVPARQYTTIAVVAVVVFLKDRRHLTDDLGWKVAIGHDRRRWRSRASSDERRGALERAPPRPPSA